MATCAGSTKAGKACKHKAFAGSAYCKIHDADYKAMRRDKLREMQEKGHKTLQYIGKKVGMKHYLEGEYEEALAKTVKSHQEDQIVSYVNKEILPIIHRLALAGSDTRSYPKNQTPIPRKAWMVVSWHLRDDRHSYASLALSCKELYKVLVDDKVCHYVHPLRLKFRSPLLFVQPVYRILSLEVPEDLDGLLSTLNFPLVSEMLEAYADAYGKPSSKLVETQRRAEVMIDLIKRMMTTMLPTEEDLEENIKGGGIFDHFHSEAKFELKNFPHPHKVHKQGPSTYLIVDAQGGKGLDRLLTAHLVSFDGRFLIQLMRL